MADIQSNIKVNIDTSNALEQIKLLQSQISAFHTQMGKGGAAAAAQAAQLRQSLVNGINATGKFSAQMTNVKTSTEYFTSALEKNKLTMGEYFRYAGGASKTFGKLFKSEFETITKVARERVKDLQTQYIKMGRDANGAMQAIKVRPLMLDMDNLATKQAISSQKQQLLNQLLKQGSTNMLNFGKNTQWAGRQLMVGFTVPLMMLGSVAIKSFKEMEEAVVKFKRVYGDLSTGSEETNKMASDLKRLAESFTQYGVAVKDTMDMAATAAATGKMGADLIAQVSSATKLAVLGGVDQQKALETTISLTNAFGLSAEDLAKKIDFLNAVENQTVLSIDDLTTAIPKAAPVVQQLGGSVEDLAFFLTAMKEGGINASEGANALKSGLASLINPTNTASKMLAGFGINIKGIVQADKGNLKKTVVDFASALDKLDPLNRARAIEQMFGKFQFARLSTLFKNVVDQGSQAGKTLELTKATNEELAILSERELKKVSDSPLYKFEKSMKDFQNAMVPIGEQFLKALTPILNFVNGILKQFDGLGEGTKNFIVGFTAILAGVGPIVLMVVGLIANGIANIIKLFANFKSMFNNMGKSSKDLGSSTKYMTSEQIEAAAVAASLDQVHGKLTQTFTSEAVAIQKLVAEYQKAITAQEIFAGTAIPRGPMPRKYATGGVIRGPGSGTSDSILARLSNGEAVIPAASVSRYPGLVNQLVSGNVPGFEHGAKKLNVAGQGYSVIRGHLTDDIKYGNPMHEEAIAKTSFGKIYSTMGRYMTVVSNLVAEMPHKLNVLLQEKVGKDGVRRAIGATPQQFSEQWNKRNGKLLLSAGLGGYDVNSPQAMKYSMQLEKAIHDRAIAMAMATERQKIDDPILAKATRQVIDETIRAGGEAKQFATSLDVASKQVGQIRMNLPASVLKEGLASGRFVADGKNILYDGQNVGRLRSTGGFRPANPFKPSRSYNVAALKSLATEDGVKDGQAYNAGKKSQTDKPQNDPYVESRNRNSPHALAGPDGAQDGKAYNAGRLSTIPELEVSEAEAARAMNMSMTAIAAQGGEAEGIAHAEARIAAAKAENAEVIAIREQGAATEMAIIEEVNAAEMAGVGGVVAGGAGLGRRATIKAERKLARKEARGGKGMGAMMALSMLPMAASAIPGDIGKAAQDNMMPLMALSMLPMLGAKIGGIAVVIGLLVASIMSFINAVNDARDKALELAMTTGTSAEALMSLSKSAGRVTAGEVMDRRRLEQNGVLAIQPGQHTFGESFVQSEAGKSLMSSIGQNTKENGAAFAAEQLAKQMESAVMSGAMSMAQARSSVAAIATAMGDRQLGINIIGKMTELLGPDGENLTKDGLGLKVRLDMVQKEISGRTGIKAISSKASEMRPGDWGNVLGYGAAGAGAGATAGAIAGGILAPATAGIALPILTVFGTIVGGIAGVIHGMEDRAARISKAGGAFAGMDKNSLDQNKQILDSFELQYQKKHELLIEQGKINEAVKLENKYYEARDKLLKATQGNKQDIIDNYLNNIKNDSELAGAYKTGVENQINKIYKNTNFSEMSQLAIDEINNSSLLNDSSKMSLSLSLEDKTLNPENIISLIDMFNTQDKMDAFLNIDTKFGSTFSSQAFQVMSGFVDSAGNLMPELQTKFMLELSTKSSKDATKLLNTFTTLTSFGNVIPTDISVKVFENSPTKITELQKVIDGVNNQKGKISFDIATKILGGEKLSEFSKQAKIFNGLSEAGRRVFIAAYQTELSLKGDPKQMQAFELWQADHPGMGPADYPIFAGTQAEKIAKTGIDLTTSLDGGASTEATTPQASFLDQIVKGYRDAFSWQQKLTVGFTKSKAAIDGFMVRGFNGLAMQLAKAGVGSDAIQAILDAPQEEIDQIIDKTTGKIKTSFLKTLPKLAALNPFSLANITTRWLTMTKDQQDEKRIAMYQAGLDVIKDKEDKINKKYDERTKALDKIQSLQDKTNVKEQDTLSLADALSKGDIAAAARAAQQMKENNAKAAIQATRDSLELSRQTELDNVTTTLNGKTVHRKELEQDILGLQVKLNIHKKQQLEKEIRIGNSLNAQLKTAQDIAALGGGNGSRGNSDDDGNNNDDKKIIPKKDPNLLTQKQLDDMKANDPESVIELKKSHSLEWNYLEQKITPLITKIQGLGTQMAAIAKQYPFVTSVKASEKDLGNGRLNANEQRALYEYRQFGKAKSGWESDVTRLRKDQSVLGETGPGYYATGGHITGPGSGTSDDIPAMLSNGEYVVRAGAVKALGVSTLDKINQADRMKFANGGMAIPRFANGGYPKFADGGYNGPRPAPQWDEKGRWVVSRGESYWSTAENTLPGGMDVGPWWSRILKSNIDPTTGKERRLYRNSRIWIPGSQEPFPPKSGIPRIFPKKKKPLYVGGGEPISLIENHMYGGNGGSNGLGNMTKLFANGGMVGYAPGGMVKRDTGAPNPFLDPMGWLQGLINGTYAGGGNPSAYLDNTAAKTIKTGAKNTSQFYKDFIFDPSSPIDYAFAAVPGALRQAGKQVAKGASKFGFPLVLQTPKKGLRITPTHLLDEAEGATPGAYRTIDGENYYVKRPDTTVETTGEFIGSTLWAKLGLGGPKLQMLSRTTLASKIIPNLIPSSSGSLRQYIEKAPNKVDAANTLAKATRKYIDEALPTNALLGNSDTHGMNILFNKKTKRFENIDLGITALTTESPDSVALLFADELAKRTRYLVDGMKSSGFNLRQTNDILKKNGLSEVSGEDFRHISFVGMGTTSLSDFIKNAKYKKSLTPQINKISNMLGFDLKKSGLDPVNVAAINAKTNPLIQDMIKNSPELAKWMNLTSKTEDLQSGMTGGLRDLFYRLQNASKNPIQKFANGGLVGYKNGGKVGKAEDTAMSNRWMAMGNFFANNKPKPSKPKETRRRLVNNQMIYMAATDPKAPWNNGNWAQNGNDPELRKRYWQQYGWRPSWIKEEDPTSTEVMDVAKTMSYFIPGVGALTSFGDAGTSAEKKDYAGAAINTAFGASSLWMPGALKLIGEGLSKAGGMVRTGLGLRGGSNALKALAAFVGTNISKVGKLAPRLGFNISDEALQSMIKDNFYGNMRTGIRSSTSDSYMNRVAVEKNMMGIPANAPASKTPAYGFLTPKEDVPSYWNSVWGGMGPRSIEQEAIDRFNLLVNGNSRYLSRYGNNTIKLKPSTLGRATISMGDSLSIWDQAIRLGQKIPGVNKLSSIFSTFPSLSGVLKSTQNMMNKDIPGIKTPTSLPYIEAHLPGGFTLKDVESIVLNPTTKFGPHAKEKIAADLAERKAALEQLFESMGIRGIKITENNGIKIGSEALDGNYPLPTKGPSKYTFMDVIKGLMPAPKGTGVDKVTGSKPLMNPNLSLFFKNLFGNNYHGGFNVAQRKNGLYKQAPFDVTKRPAKPDYVDPESWNTNWFRAEFFSTAAKKLASTYGQMFNVKMPLLSPLKMNMLDLYPGAKSVAEQYPELYAKHPNLFGAEGDLLRPDRHLSLAEMIAHNPDLVNILKEFGIDAIRHQSAHGVQATLGGKGIFSEVFAYLNPAKGMKASPMPFANKVKFEKTLFENVGKDNYMRRIKNMMLNPFKRIGYNVQNFFKDMFKDKPDMDVETLANGGYVNGGMAIPRFKVGGYVRNLPKFYDGGLANLHEGEYVFQKSAVDRIGLNNLNAMNQGNTVSSDSVYNYNINLNVSSVSDPSQIADSVLLQIKRLDSQRIRGINV